MNADYLFLMTDVDGLYTSNPRTNPDAEVIEVVSDISALEADVSSAGSSLGTGGMTTKITAARLASSAGVTTVITKSSRPGSIHEIVEYLQRLENPPAESDSTSEESDSTSISSPLHTRFVPSTTPIRSRSFWILHGLNSHGTMYIDSGAYDAISNKSALLPAGVVGVEGHFGQQEAVRLVVIGRRPASALNGDFPLQGEEPKEVGRALVNYDSTEIRHIKGLRSTQIHSVLGYAESEYVALKENISFFHVGDRPSRPATPGLDEIMSSGPSQASAEGA